MKNSLFIIACLLCSNTFSIGSYSGTVSDVRIDRDGRGIIAFDGPVVGAPASCRIPAYASHLSFDTNTAGGKAIYSMALAAASSGKTISVYGTGNCDDYANTVEGLLYWHYFK